MEAEDLCTICWSTPTTRASISDCRHTFCLDCIEQWSSRENRCPLCKTRFERISWNSEGTAQSKVVETKNQFNQHQAYFIAVNMMETQEMRHILTLGRTATGFSFRVGLHRVAQPVSSSLPREEHDEHNCELCSLMRSVEMTRDLRHRRDSDATM
ncbi:hypothetical protein FisN_7Lh204 [Fistulifera solaris]|uniref:RING-type domain-containing protein n=1 Tax=Fistulifera solaris TaxID=1519565 RepID=A0A1Z5JCZ3_FISSO|nr:hypothetical protein FisN_7Lh204 [Fistulifera solaris]|eukprot:GAX11816.1 hypothetical protein FisN_7Lh204 [Fistulifera solaris]